MKAAKVFTLVRIFLEIPGWWYAVVNVGEDTQCGNYGKILSHIFDKNFVKATFPYSFCKIFVISIREDLSFLHTVGPKGHDRNHVPNPKMHNIPIWILYEKNGVSLEGFRRRIVHWSEKCTNFCSFFFLENIYIF